MIRTHLKAATLLMLTASLLPAPSLAEDKLSLPRAPAKNEARLPKAQIRADAATAFVAPDGRVMPLAAERLVEAEVGPQSACTQAPAANALRAQAKAIAGDEGAPIDVVLAILGVETRIRGELPPERPDLATIAPKPEQLGRECDPAPQIRAGIRRFNALRGKYQNPLQLYAAYHAGEEFLRDAAGVPTYPATLRFVAAVINELSRAPVFDTLRAPSARPQTRGGRDLALSREPSSPRREPSGDPRWASGFVLNFE